MNEQMSTLLIYLTDIPVNIWFYLLVITIPFLVFGISPDGSYRIRLGRLIIAVILAYMLLNLSLHTSRSLDHKDYYKCQNNSNHPEMSLKTFEECKNHITIADGASAVFYLYFGWIPASAIVGFWELLWRIYHMNKLKTLGKNYDGRWFSNIVICTFIPFAMAGIYFIQKLIYYLTFKP